MKNFGSSLITGILAVLAAITGLIFIFLSWGVMQGSVEIDGLFLSITVAFIATLALTVKRKWGWTEFWSNLLPWA